MLGDLGQITCNFLRYLFHLNHRFGTQIFQSAPSSMGGEIYGVWWTITVSEGNLVPPDRSDNQSTSSVLRTWTSCPPRQESAQTWLCPCGCLYASCLLAPFVHVCILCIPLVPACKLHNMCYSYQKITNRGCNHMLWSCLCLIVPSQVETCHLIKLSLHIIFLKGQVSCSIVLR